MRYTTFGRSTGLRISQYALGTGNFGTGWGAGAERDEARKIFERFVAAGGNFIDTADVYQAGQSEEMLGELIQADRSDLVVASKFTVGLDGGISRTGNSRKNLRTSVEASLRRLGTDYLDILWVHYPDALTPVDEIVRGLDDLARQGKILHGGLSNFPAWRVARAVTLAEAGGLAPIAGIQVEYSLVERTPDRELLPMAEALGVCATLWSPLGGGLLTGKYRTSDAGRLTDLKRLVHTESDERKTAVVDAVLEIAGELDRPAAQVAMAWANRRALELATPVVPIIGPRSLAQLDTYLAALEVELSDDQFDRLSHVSAVVLGVPHDANARALNGLQGSAAQQFRRPAVPVA